MVERRSWWLIAKKWWYGVCNLYRFQRIERATEVHDANIQHQWNRIFVLEELVVQLSDKIDALQAVLNVRTEDKI